MAGLLGALGYMLLPSRPRPAVVVLPLVRSVLLRGGSGLAQGCWHRWILTALPGAAAWTQGKLASAFRGVLPQHAAAPTCGSPTVAHILT